MKHPLLENKAYLRYGKIFFLIGISGCRFSDITAPRPQMPDARKPTQEIEEVSLEILEEGKPKLRVQAGSMARFERGDSVFALLGVGKSKKPVRVALFDPSGKPSANISMEKLRFEEATLHLTATGNVQVETATGRRLQAEHIIWDNVTRKLTTKGLVRMISDQEQLQGYDLVTDESMTNYSARKLTGQVRISGL